MDRNEKLLIGSWQPIEDHIFLSGRWYYHADYEDGKSCYTFDGIHFTSYGTGFFIDGAVYPYFYKPLAQGIQLKHEIIRLVNVSDTHLTIDVPMKQEEPYKYFVRVILRRFSEK